VATARSEELRGLAQRIAEALPPDVLEVIVTGSVSRGVADDASDMEMLIVTETQLELSECFDRARALRLERLETWGAQGTPTNKVSGRLDGTELELIWWSRAFAEERIDGALAGDPSATGDALANGLAVRTSGLFADWQERLRAYPEEVAAARIEEAAERWGGFTPAGVLTLLRAGDRLATAEWLVESATRVLTIVFALNRVWQPTSKRLAARVAPLAVTPERLAERIELALAEDDQRRALRLMSELQLDAVVLAPDGPNVVRARAWLAEAVDLLQ
jgi:predicted nucleotidyltransferase